METIQLLLVITMLVILAEVTYLVVKLPRQNIGKKQSRPIFVDTSVLIDGRILAVANSGFIGDTLVIPRSVIGELQFLADNADHEKRSRARHGLDVVTELQNMPQVTVEILQDGSKAEEGVDERLLVLAKKHSGAICTIDYNLNKVAVVEGIAVLNVNELAQSLRMAYLPGEKIMLELVQKGQDGHQAVGYLPDGTMVVVEHANKFIGQSVEIEFIRSLQTAAGKMMFARRVEKKSSSAAPSQSKHSKPAGKKLVETKEAQSTQEKPPQKKQTAVYHTDERDQRTAKKRQQPKQGQSSRQSKPQAKRPRSSADREAALIDLVDKM